MTGQAAIKLENNRLVVSGDLDFSSVVTLWNMSLPLLNQCSSWCFDFSGVTSTKSAGLALLIEWMKLAQREHKKIIFENIPQQLLTIASVCSVEAILKSVSVSVSHSLG